MTRRLATPLNTTWLIAMLEVTLNPSEIEVAVNPDGLYIWISPYMDAELREILKKLHVRYLKRALTVFSGRNRNVFIMPGNYVVELPTCLDGVADNDWEGSVSNSIESLDNPLYVQYPKTKLAYQDGVPVVFMERITPLNSGTIWPRARLGYECRLWPGWSK